MRQEGSVRVWGVCACELDDACGGDQSFEVLKCGGQIHLIATQVVPVSRGADDFFFFFFFFFHS